MAVLMKALTWFAIVALGAAVLENDRTVTQDRTITKVVKLLQKMLDTSKTEGDEERVIYAKLKCYCDTSEADKKASIKELTEQIALLETNIAKTQGSTGALSSECANLKTKLADNEAARDDATSVRDKENKAFVAEESDLEAAIAQMISAIETLTAVGADQTKSTGADNSQFMAGHKGASLLNLQSQVQTALSAATALMNKEQQGKTTAFLQAPFTGTYTSQSGAVMGIIKNMRDTFDANLADARTTEKNSLKAYNKFMDLKIEGHKMMTASYESKQKELGGNDGSLGSDKETLSSAKAKKASDEEFLGTLLPMCEEKAQAFEKRNLLQANEEAAIAEAISILDSDDAFATFATTDATKTGGAKFIQMRSVRRHMSGDVHVRSVAQNMLQKAASDVHSTRLSKVVASLQANNPFESVLKEIDNMIELIAEEGKADKVKLDWCNEERKNNEDSKSTKESQITGLDEKINTLTDTINNAETGLKAIIAQTEESLLQNKDAQDKDTKQRAADLSAYQKDVSNLQAAQDILERATKVLTTYYDDLADKIAFVQEDPAPPSAELNTEGQSKQGGDVIGMLQFILKETKAEETQADEDEKKSREESESFMEECKTQEAADEKILAKTQDDLATSEQDLLEAQEDLKDTTKDHDDIVAYLAQIKPGCDFITENFDTRESNRETESNALKKAITLIKATPAYTTFTAEATVESYGDCKEPCEKDAKDVKCLACMADVTVPAYCAGHADAAGC